MPHPSCNTNKKDKMFIAIFYCLLCDCSNQNGVGRLFRYNTLENQLTKAGKLVYTPGWRGFAQSAPQDTTPACTA